MKDKDRKTCREGSEKAIDQIIIIILEKKIITITFFFFRFDVVYYRFNLIFFYVLVRFNLIN